MAKILFSKKQFRATVGRKSSAFNKIMGNKNIARVVNTAAEKREFYGALRDQALKKGSVGMRKSDLKRALGKLEKAKSLSNYERHVIGEELIGGSASSRVIHDHESAGNSVSGKPKIDMGKVYQEIMNKGKNGVTVDTQKNNNLAAAPSKALDFGVSAKNLRNAQRLFVQTDNDYPTQNRSSSVAEYIANRQDTDDDVNNVKNMLAKIQEKPEVKEEEKTSLTQKYPETSNQETIDKPNDKDAVANIDKDGIKAMLAKIQEKPDEEKNSKNEPAKKDDYEKIDEKNTLQTIKKGQEKIQEMSLAGQESNPDYQKLFSLLMKNKDGKDVWKSAEEIDMASIEADIKSIIEKNSKEEEKPVIVVSNENEPKSTNDDKIKVENKKTDLAT